MNIKAGQDVLLVVTWDTTTFCYETVARRVTTYSLVVDHPREEGKAVSFREGDHLLIVTQPDSNDFYFLDTLFLSLDAPDAPIITLLLHGRLWKCPDRQHLRTLINIPVQIFPLGPSAPEPFKTQSVNLSSGGVLVPAPYSLPLATPVLVSLFLQGHKPELQVRAFVRRAEKTTEHSDTANLLAFEFSQAEAKVITAIGEFVKLNHLKIIHRARTRSRQQVAPTPVEPGS